MKTSLLIAFALIVAGCSSTAPQTPPAKAGPAPAATAAGSPKEMAQPQPDVDTGPQDVAIGDLVPDENREVRIKGVVAALVGMRLVPPKVILKVRDNTGTVTVVINEKQQFSEGTRMELVGTYKEIPSPMYDGPGEAPTEPVFVVERFLDLP